MRIVDLIPKEQKQQLKKVTSPKKQAKKKNQPKKPKNEKFSQWEIEELMGTRRDRYYRSNGAIKRR